MKRDFIVELGPALAVILRNALKRNALKLLNELDSSTITKSQLGYIYTPKAGAYDAVREQIADICMSMSAKDYLSVPE
jgi:hypothetical protein